MDDLISRKAARTAVYGYEMQTGIAEMPLEFAHNKIDKVPSVPAVPLDKLCKWLAAEHVTIPCHLCDHYENGRCSVENDMKTTYPEGADKWRKVLEKGMEVET